jgi:hypothetical protein
MDFWGNYEAGDVADLVRAKDFEVEVLRDAYVARGGPAAVFSAPSWPAGAMGFAGDPDGTWAADTNAMVNRYGAARAIATGIAPGSLFDATSIADAYNAAYAGVLRALQRMHGAVSPGDLQDVWARLQRAQAFAEGATPQPTTPDEQLLAFQTVDRGIRAGERAARGAIATGVPLVALGLLGLLVLELRRR